MIDKISLKNVKISDSRFLFDLLAERSLMAFISHRRMPIWEEHIRFLRSKPYSKWYIIKSGTKRIGSISLTNQNEIGIWIKKNMKGKGVGTIALKLLIKKNPNLRYLANISPQNKESERFFKKNGFKLIQYTYEITNPK